MQIVYIGKATATAIMDFNDIARNNPKISNKQNEKRNVKIYRDYNRS